MTDADTSETPEPVVLKGDDAVALWRSGRAKWNLWISLNPNAEIDFSNVDFSEEMRGKKGISFSGYNFGGGSVSFEYANFGEGNVSFFNAVFDSENVLFDGVVFKAGRVSFNNVKFRDGVASFSGVNFGHGRTSFSHAVFNKGAFFSDSIFGDGGVFFEGSKFNSGDVLFDSTKFGHGRVSFDRVNIRARTVSFENAEFDDGEVFFQDATVEAGHVSFIGSHFAAGRVSFDGTKFFNGVVSFDAAEFRSGEVSFQRTAFENLMFIPSFFGSTEFLGKGMRVSSSADFTFPFSTSAFKAFDLRGGSFDGPLSLKMNLLSPPDLRGVKAAHHVEIGDLTVTLRRGVPNLSWPPKLSLVAEDRDDAARLRRLKEIAETNRDHRAALRFSADENRARRWNETSWHASVLDMGFSFLSDYGQSIWRPTAALAVLTTGCFALYWHLTDLAGAGWKQAALLSISNSLPFLPQSQTFRIEGSEALFCAGTGHWVDIAMVAQGVASVVLLFLVGLGLRNRFRL